MQWRNKLDRHNANYSNEPLRNSLSLTTKGFHMYIKQSLEEEGEGENRSKVIRRYLNLGFIFFLFPSMKNISELPQVFS